MEVVLPVGVFVLMDCPIPMAMPMGMGVASCGPSYSPYRVEEAEPYEGPGCPDPP